MKKTAAVTGGSGGIGAALCEELAEKGYYIYSLSRHSGEGKAEHIRTDVTDDASVAAAFSRIERERGRLDLLINNAGFGISGAIEFTSTEKAKRQFDVNLFGMHSCVRYALPLLRQSKGRIINISSAAAIFPIPFQAFYSASKAAINSFSLALANEVRCFGISVCAIMPGDVRTGFTAQRKKSSEGNELYGGVIDPTVSVMEHDEENGMSPEDVAAYITRIALKKRIKPLYCAGTLYKLYSLLDKLLPARAVNAIIGMMYIKKPK